MKAIYWFIMLVVLLWVAEVRGGVDKMALTNYELLVVGVLLLIGDRLAGRVGR